MSWITMRGVKRSAISDSTPVFGSNGSSMQSKRLVMGSQFDAQKAEPSSIQQLQPLDTKRAESSRQHVRALNSQFARWIQAQLRSNPDEIWDDGVQDYLNHAKSILEKFSDVVNWLKINTSKGESSHQPLGDSQMKPTSGISINSNILFSEKPGFSPNVTVDLGLNSGKLQSSDTQKRPAWEADKNKFNLFSAKPGFPPVATARFGETSSQLHSNDTQVKPSLETDKINHKPGFPPAGTATFGTSYTPGFLSNNNNNATFSFGGNQVSASGNVNSVPSNQEVSNEEDGDDAEQPSSPSLKKSEEKGICVVHEVKCKLYVKSIDQADKDAWRDKGMGILSIKCKEGVTKGTKESKPTIVIRNDVGKVLLNALLYPGIKTNTQKNSVVAIFHTLADGSNDNVVAQTFLMRTKTIEDGDKLAAAIQEYAPAA